MKPIQIIAEIGQNFNGDLELAKELIRLSKKCGADVAKFQVYDAKSLFPSKEDGNNWFEYNCKTELTKKQISVLIEECQKNDIEFMASAFDPTRVEWLEELGVDRYKIASRSIKDNKLIDAILKTGKPVIASLGMWNGDDFPDLNGRDDIDYLYCVSKYPTQLSELNFSKIDFSKYAGFSDHTLGIVAPTVAMSRGARIIEKHLTIDKNMYGPDHSCSMTPSELSQLVEIKNNIISCL